MRIKSAFAAPFLLIVVLALFAVSAFIDPSGAAGDVNPYLTVIIIELLVYALPSVFFCRLRGKNYAARLRARPFRLNHIFFMLLALAVMIAGCALINLGMYSLFPSAAEADASEASAYGANLYAVLAYCIFPALTEEFLFRGIILAEYESVSVPFAVLTSSLCFALMHLSFVRLPAYFFSGVILSLILYATRSILAPMLVHGLNNIAALWMDRYLQRVSGAPAERGALLVFILGCVFFVSLILLFLEGERIYAGYGVTNLPSPYVRRRKKNEPGGALETLAAPPFILYIVMSVVFTLMIS
ncbi:MAG: lysostaphin resistance A-like protein [Eubacteriales bacterium]